MSRPRAASAASSSAASASASCSLALHAAALLPPASVAGAAAFAGWSPLRSAAANATATGGNRFLSLT